MNNLKLIVIALAFITSGVAFSQASGQLRGNVSDADTGEPLPGT